jgi:hypothetical protein
MAGTGTALPLRSCDFCVVTQSCFLWFLTNVSGPYIRPIFRVQLEHQEPGCTGFYIFPIWTLKMGRIYGPETFVKNGRKATLGNNPKVTTSYCNPGGSFKSHSFTFSVEWLVGSREVSAVGASKHVF